MIRNQAQTTQLLTPRRKPSLAFLAGGGLVFWFIVAFPFSNHNESYFWLAKLQNSDAREILSTKTLAATFRPVGQFLAYVGWRISGSGDSTWAVQAFNLVMAEGALWITALAMTETLTFTAVALVTTTAFFAGYVYLFHIHGIFYGPVLLIIAALLYCRRTSAQSRLRADLAAFLACVAVGLLVHPYALIIFGGYATGRSVEQWRETAWADRLSRMSVIALALLALLAMRPGHQAVSIDSVRAFWASYSLTEVVPALKLLSALLAGATLISIVPVDRAIVRVMVLSAVGVCSVVLFLSSYPVIVLWVLAAIVKTLYRREWSLAGMTAATAVLPAIAPSGSPTYSIFAIFMSTVVLVEGSNTIERFFQRLAPVIPLAAASGAILLAVLLRLGVNVPVASRLVRPVLAEREKTIQLQAVVNWMLESDYRNARLLVEGNANPVDAGVTAVDRRSRPPTYQGYLDTYLESRRKGPTDGQILLVTFGTTTKEGLLLTKALPGRFAGEALVYR